MKRLICFSLWGKDEKYTTGALKNADLALDIYPGWICRYYVGKSVPVDIINSLIEKSNTEVFIMNEGGDWTSMFWRFLPAADSTVDYMISRDTDSRLNLREKEAVDQWISDGASFHIMRDHPLHATEILGGMWGCRGASNDALSAMATEVDEYVKGDFWQVDQNFLRERIFPAIKNDCLVHDPYFEKKPFPSPRRPFRFVGQAFNADDTFLEPKHGKML